ncbi:uncharacterized protein LOC135098383 isoform X2 [Scylla paramamosain]|uniref:uncharacterized protein LOC135098383 isoform X2 n=1 Tax=Scylla paramamosain TaxID=85552 RepID=UPI003082FB4A
MWKTRVVFVTVFTCVFLTSHASEIESTTSRRDNHEDNGDINQEPEVRVRSLQCDSRRCTATVENNCVKYNGYNMKMQFILKPSSKKFKSPLVKYGAVNSEGRATIALKDLLPFTNYTVTANPANDVGAATDPSLTKETSFIAISQCYWNPRTRAEIDAKTTLRFTWNGLRSNNGNPGYYTLTFLDGRRQEHCEKYHRY